MTESPMFIVPPSAQPAFQGWIVEPPPALRPAADRLGIAFAWGLLSTILASIVSLPFAGVTKVVTGLLAVVIAPIIEESCKAGAVLLTLRKRPALLAEGWLLVGVAAGLGFSLVENILYAGVFALASPTYGGLILFQRFLISTPIHMVAAGLVAYGIGSWRERRDPLRAALWCLAGVAVHGGSNAWFLTLGGGW